MDIGYGSVFCLLEESQRGEKTPDIKRRPEMARGEEGLPRWAKIFLAVFFIGLLIWAIVPGKILYITIAIVVVIAGGVSYLIYKKQGIEPFKIFGKKSYRWLKEEKQQTEVKEGQEKKGVVVKAPPLTGPERAKLINAAGNRCENPSCREKYPLEVHHIKPIAEGGSNKLSNLIVLCKNCHGKFQGGIYSRELLKEWISTKSHRRFRYYLKWKY